MVISCTIVVLLQLLSPLSLHLTVSPKAAVGRASIANTIGKMIGSNTKKFQTSDFLEGFHAPVDMEVL